MSEIVSGSGICVKCLMPWDCHCLLHEPVPLCPVNIDGALKTPCKATGPKETKK